MTTEELFWSHVAKTPTCWLWTGTRNYAGYGVMKSAQRQYRAHRFAYELLVGPVPKGLLVCHRCDNPPCCNPAHLFVGTPLGNTTDARIKGRMARGQRQHSARLTEAQVVEIRARRAAGELLESLGRSYGVNRTTIARAVKRGTWAWLA